MAWRRLRAPRLVDQPGVHVGVDGHLLAGQCVEGEAGGDLGGAHRAMRDDQKLNGDQGQKQHEADDVVAAHHKLPEGLDHLARRGRALRAMQQNAAAGGDVERQPEEREQQQQRGKDAKLDGAAHLHGGEKDDDRGGHRKRQQQVEAHGRQRHQHDEDHADGGQGQQHTRAAGARNERAAGERAWPGLRCSSRHLHQQAGMIDRRRSRPRA